MTEVRVDYGEGPKSHNSDGWISVEEQMPRNRELVMGWMRHKKRPGMWSKTLVLEFSDKRHGWWVEAGGYPVSPMYRVTHWRPLPKPPKEMRDD